MLATLVYRRLGRTLVLMRSAALRSQITRKFISLGVLPAAQVIGLDLLKQRVAVITTATGVSKESRPADLLKAFRISAT